MELFVLAICSGACFWFGANYGYKLGREYKDESGILNVEVLIDQNTGNCFAYEMSNKKFILQTPDESALPELLSARFPNMIIIVSKTHESV